MSEGSSRFSTLEELERKSLDSSKEPSEAGVVPWISFFRTVVAFFAVLAAASIHGYNTGVLNLPEEALFQWIEQCDLNTTLCSVEDALYSTKITWTWIVSVYNLGGVFGGLMVAFVVSNFGETQGLFLSAIMTVVGTLLETSAKPIGSKGFLISGRFLVGLSVGLDSGKHLFTTVFEVLVLMTQKKLFSFRNFCD